VNGHCASVRRRTSSGAFTEGEDAMAIHIPPLPEGTRVRVRQADLPQEPAVTGRLGTVVSASEYTAHEIGVVLDDENTLRWFTPDELEVTEALPPVPERIEAKRRRALP
jgi:hypothetical protein